MTKVINRKGVAIRAPAPAMSPFIDGIWSSRRSDKYPPDIEAGRPPPIIVTVTVTEMLEIWSGHLCSKKLPERSPTE